MLPFISSAIIQDYQSTTRALPFVAHDPNTVVVILDISGYTRATRIIMEQAEQREGASFNASEYVGKLVKHCLDPLLNLVVEHGGDVLKYGGDAVFCLWRVSSISSSAVSIRSAIHCCIEAARYVRRHPLSDFDDNIIPLAVHSVIHWSSVDLIHVGDVNSERIEAICYGSDYLFACSLLDVAEKDQIVLSDKTLRCIGGKHSLSSFEISDILSFDQSHYHVMIVDTKSKSRENIDQPSKPSRTTINVQNVPSAQLKLLSYYVDASVHARSLSSSQFKSELRQATVCFIRLRRLDESLDAESLLWPLNEIFNAAVEACRPSESDAPHGIIRQLTVDDKGMSLMLLFGFPPCTTENPSVAAACVTLRILNVLRLQRLPFEASCGIATGRLFSGLITTDDASRMEHAVLGSAVNLAARFMTHEKAKHNILCDQLTSDMLKRASSLVATQPLLQPLQIKGWLQPVQAWLVLETEKQFEMNSYHQISSKLQIDFHDPKEDEEWRWYFDKWLATKSFENKSTLSLGKVNFTPFKSQFSMNTNLSNVHTFVIQGPSGAGKSVTASRIREYAKLNRVFVWDVQSFEIEQSTPFSCVRQIFHHIFSEWSKNELFQALVHKEGKHSSDADPLEILVDSLNISRRHVSVIRDLQKYFFKVASSSLQGTSAMPTSDIRTGKSNRSMPDEILKSVTDAIVDIVNAMTCISKSMVVFDDCQWQDRYSFAITVALHARCPFLSLVIISRPVREYRDPALQTIYEMIVNSSSSHQVQVGQLTLQKTQNIVRNLFPKLASHQVDSVSHRLLELSSGNAFALDVLLRRLQNGLFDAFTDPLQVLPKDTQSVFVSQLDSLENNFQLFTRMASLIGQVFHLDDIIALCDFKDFTKDTLSTQIMKWDKFGFMEPVDADRWRFKHCLISYQIYGLMTEEERKEKQEHLTTYYENVLQKNVATTRKAELWPLVYELYKNLKKEEKLYQASVKLVSLYSKMEMWFECKRYICQVMEDKKRFNDLAKNKQDKILHIGMQAAALLSDNSLMHMFVRPFSMSYGDIRLKSCILACVIQMINYASKLESVCRKRFMKTTILSNAPKIVDKHRFEIFCRLVMELAPEVPNDLKLTLQFLTGVIHVNFLVAQMNISDFEQRTEMDLSTACTLMAMGKVEVGAKIEFDLGMTTLAPDSRIMQLVQKYKTMSSQQLTQLPIHLRSFVRILSSYFILYRPHYERCCHLAREFWLIAKNCNDLHQLDGMMHFWNGSWQVYATGMNSNEDPVHEYVHHKRLSSEQHPFIVPSMSVTTLCFQMYMIVASEVLIELSHPEQYASDISKSPEAHLDLLDFEFAMEFNKNHAPPLGNRESSMFMLQHNTCFGLAYVALVHGEYDVMMDYFENFCISLFDFKGVLKTIYDSVQSSYMLRFFLHVQYLLIYPDDGKKPISVHYRKRVLLLYHQFLNHLESATRSKSTRSGMQLTEGAHRISVAMLCFVQSRTKGDLTKCIQLLDNAYQFYENVKSYLLMGMIHELKIYIYAGLAPKACIEGDHNISACTKLTKDEIEKCHFHYEKVKEIHSRTNCMWTPRHLNRFMKSLGLLP